MSHQYKLREERNASGPTGQELTKVKLLPFSPREGDVDIGSGRDNEQGITDGQTGATYSSLMGAGVESPRRSKSVMIVSHHS